MIKIVKIDGDTSDRKVYILFADTKQEVPSTGSATISGIDKLDPGSIIYTVSLDIGVLKSNDEWEWGE